MNLLSLSLGSNCGNREGNISACLQWLEEELTVSGMSHIYETPEIYGIGDPYCNCVVNASTELDMETLNLRLKSFELTHGRTQEARMKGAVPIDIDIVIWNGEIIRPKDFSREFFQIGYQNLEALR